MTKAIIRSHGPVYLFNNTKATRLTHRNAKDLTGVIDNKQEVEIVKEKKYGGADWVKVKCVVLVADGKKYPQKGWCLRKLVRVIKDE